MKYFRFLIFLFPLVFLLLFLSFKDPFYLIFTGFTFLFSFFIAKPKFLSDKVLSGLTNKKQARKDHHDKKSKSEEIIGTSNWKYGSLIFIFISILFFTILFTFTAVYTAQTVPTVKNFIYEYYLTQLLNLKHIWIYIVLLLFFATWLIPNINLHGKNKITFRLSLFPFVKHLLQGCLGLLISFIISFLIVYLYGILQLNFAVLELKFYPDSVGVIYGKNAISSKLKTMKIPLQVIGSGNNSSNIILSIIINGYSAKNSYYQERIINKIPYSLIIPFDLSNQSVVLVHNTLIINSIDKDEIQSLSPTIAHLLLVNYFKNRDLKDDPTISILNRQEYLAFRQDEINQQISKIQTAIQKVEDYINSLYGGINNAKQKIAYNQNGIQSAASNRDYYYNNCISAGYTDFFTGSFYHYYSQAYCDSNKSQWDQDIAQFQQNINDWNNTLQYDENELSNAQTAEQNLKDYAQLIENQKNSTPDELGKFDGPKTVRVVLDSTSAKGISEFLETLAHENLHYQSYVSNDRNLQFTDGTYDSFWEEGLTEYFARKVITVNLGVNVNQGYPLIVKIVAEIAKKIPETELQKIYFTKDENTLEEDLNATYGKDFYKNTEPYFEYISHLPVDKQLKYANNIMTVIGGKQLSSNDLYSTDLQP